jgi:biotin operon repressor
MENERKFLGVWIPAEVWLDHSISIIERALFAEIHSLDGPRGCFASNEYFAENFGITVATISKSITRLKEAGYIEQESFDGRRRVLRSLLHFEKQPSKKLKADTNDFEGRHQDSLSQHSNDLKHIEKKITKVDNKDYNEGDAPAHFADVSNMVSNPQPEVFVIALNDGNTQERITGPDAPKKRTSKSKPETGHIRDVLTEADFCAQWQASDYARENPQYDPALIYNAIYLWCDKDKKNTGSDWMRRARQFVLNSHTYNRPGEFVRKVQSIEQQAKMARAAGHTVSIRDEALARGMALFGEKPL